MRLTRQSSRQYVRLADRPTRRRVTRRGSNQYAAKYHGLRPKTWANVIALILFMAIVAYFGAQAKASETSPLISPLPLIPQAKADEPKAPGAPKFSDARAQKVYDFLSAKHSPLADEAQAFVEAADTYGLDWTLMPSISCKESSCGKALANDFNPFGMTSGKHTGPRFRAFQSWDDAIETEAKLLSSSYRWNANRGIQQRYCPTSECSPTWTDDVTQFSEDMLSL